MGQSSSTSQLIIHSDRKLRSQTQQEITYYLTVHDHNFGNVQVYASNKKPLCYLAKLQHQNNTSIFQVFTKIQNLQQKFLVNLFAFEIQRTQMFGFIRQKVVAFWQYYNFYLTDYLKARHIRRKALNQGQIWHIIQGCLHSCQIFQYFGLEYDLDITKIIVTPQGNIKFYWHHLSEDNSHLMYYQKLRQNKDNHQQTQKRFVLYASEQQKSQTSSFYFSPQQILLINNKETDGKINFGGCNSYRLGMIILYCVTLNNPALTCYNLNKSKIHKCVINSLIENKLVDPECYSKELIELVQLLLQEDGYKRINLNQIKAKFRSQVEKQYELLVSNKQPQNKHFTLSSQKENFSHKENKAVQQVMNTNVRNFQLNNRKSSKNSLQQQKQDDLQERRTIKIKYNSSNTSNPSQNQNQIQNQNQSQNQNIFHK